jgi:hypothetical protein
MTSTNLSGHTDFDFFIGQALLRGLEPNNETSRSEAYAA